MTAYLKEGGKLKTGLNCLHNFINEKRHYIKSGVEKDILHLVETWAEWWLNIRRHIIFTRHQVHNIWSKEKVRTEKKREKRKLAACENRKKRACLIFRSLGGTSHPHPWWGLWAAHIWYSPTGNIRRNATKRQTRHVRATFARQTVSPGRPRRLSGTSPPEGEWTYNCLIGQYLSTNGLFGTVIDVAASYVFSSIWPCNGY